MSGRQRPGFTAWGLNFLVLVLFAAGCGGTGSYKLRLVLPDSEAEQLLHELEIRAVKPGNHGCGELLSGFVDIDGLQELARTVLSFPGPGSTVLEIPAGDVIFFAEGRTDQDGVILRGCSKVRASAGSSLTVVVVLEWFCHPGAEEEVVGNGVDDDCDGLTDECVSAQQCNDNNPCTTDTCTDSHCDYVDADGNLCDDGDPCTDGDHCVSGSCMGDEKDCSDYDGTCVVGVCDPQDGTCRETPAPDGTGCDDGQYCTAGDQCSGGACQGAPRDCDDDDPCTLDGCDDNQDACIHTREPRPGLEGPRGDPSCTNGLDDDCDGLTDIDDPNCGTCTADAQCDDNNPCTLDQCVGGQCVNSSEDQEGEPCDDGLNCSVRDACIGGVCRGTPRNCSMLSDTCHFGMCDEGTGACIAQQKITGAGCDDGKFCTVGDACAADGACIGIHNDCDDGNHCTSDTCNELLERCDHLLDPVAGVEGPPGSAFCSNGVDDDCDGLIDLQDTECRSCTGGAECNDDNPCTDDACVDNVCQNAAASDGTVCDDGLYCTENDACVLGVCTGAVRDCSDDDPCTQDTCDEATDRCENVSLVGLEREICGDGLDQDCDGVADGCCLGEGTFTVSDGVPVPGPSGVAVADFNQDGILDLVVGSSTELNVQVFLGNGSGGQGDATFTPGEVYGLLGEREAADIIAADFNADGIHDLAIAENRVTILLGNGANGAGDGTFDAAGMAEYGQQNPRKLYTADADEDGIHDLGDIAGGSGEILMGGGSDGRGDATFTGGWSSYAADPTDILAGDFDADGILDLAALEIASDRLFVFPGDGTDGRGNGNFRLDNFGIPVGGDPSAFVAEDFDCDGILDFAITQRENNQVHIMLGTGSDGMGDGDFAGSGTYAVGEAPGDIAGGNFNGDGILDLAVANSGEDTVSILLGDGSGGRGDGTFSGKTDVLVGSQPLAVVAGDFNADGIIDFAVPCAGDDRVKLLLGQGSGSRANAVLAPPYDVVVPGGAKAAIARDLDADGLTDLAVSNYATDTVSILLAGRSGGKGDGTFLLTDECPAGLWPQGMAAGDFNRDAIPDLAVANYGDNAVSILAGGGADGQGSGTCLAPIDHSVGLQPCAVVCADFDDDSILDLAVASSGADAVDILLGDGANGRGDGTFSMSGSYATGFEPTALAVGDFDADAIEDLVVCNAGSDTVTVLLGGGSEGRGDGTFTAAGFDHPTCAAPGSVVVADFNEDAILDLAVTCSGEDVINVLLGSGSDGLGDGTFSSRAAYTVGQGPVALVAGNLNADDILDLAAVSLDDGMLSILIGGGSNGRGDGTFEDALQWATEPGPGFLVASDFHADGILDFVVAHTWSGLEVFAGRGACLSSP